MRVVSSEGVKTRDPASSVLDFLLALQRVFVVRAMEALVQMVKPYNEYRMRTNVGTPVRTYALRTAGDPSPVEARGVINR